MAIKSLASFPVSSPPSQGAWIEILLLVSIKPATASPPSQGAWIEIDMALVILIVLAVAPLAGGVD